MATHTWVDLHIQEAARLADLSGILWDLQRAREFAQMLAAEFAAIETNWRLVEPLSIAATVMYSRAFSGGVRHRLDENDLAVLTSAQRVAHDHLRAYRDKHVAHSVNVYEENIARANYCEERVKEEGITSISYGSRAAGGEYEKGQRATFSAGQGLCSPMCVGPVGLTLGGADGLPVPRRISGRCWPAAHHNVGLETAQTR